jgi:hypothetical protein
MLSTGDAFGYNLLKSDLESVDGLDFYPFDVYKMSARVQVGVGLCSPQSWGKWEGG